MHAISCDATKIKCLMSVVPHQKVILRRLDWIGLDEYIAKRAALSLSLSSRNSCVVSLVIVQRVRFGRRFVLTREPVSVGCDALTVRVWGPALFVAKGEAAAAASTNRFVSNLLNCRTSS